MKLNYFCNLLVLSFFSLGFLAQNQTQKWYFGTSGLDFATNPPTALTNSSMYATEGCASISDAAGNLLFYTNGTVIYNKIHNVMANGTGLLGHISTTQSSIIIRQPGSSTIYYVFTLDQLTSPNGLCYSVVDMSLAAGMGSVTVKNTFLYAPSCEKLAATLHCNGTDVWVVTHDWNSANFRAYLVTAAGVNSIAVVSTAGTVITGSTPNTLGQMKISPNGKKLGLATWDFNSPSSFAMYDFDPATGNVSNPLTLMGLVAGYGCEFSPDGSKFYGTETLTSKIYQWNLCAGTSSAIAASVFTMSGQYGTCAMQLAQNGKIYIAVNGTSFLNTINNPNAAGAACGFSQFSQSLFPTGSGQGLPNFLSNHLLNLPAFTFSTNPAPACMTASFNYPIIPGSTVCAQVGYDIATMAWSFGDPASGPTNTSTLSNPNHIFSAPGSYTVQLVLYNSCGGVLDTLSQPVTVSAPPILSNGGFAVCAGQSLTLTTSGAGPYVWSTGATGSSVVITPPASTVISISGTNAQGCVGTASQVITVNQPPVLTIAGPTNVCIGAVITLTAMGAFSYTWSNGNLTALQTLTPASTSAYTLTGRSVAGCVNSKTVSISVSPVPTIAIAGSSVVCAGSVLTQTASGAATYTWSMGGTGTSISITPTVNMSLVVSGTDASGCVGSAAKMIMVNPSPTLTMSGHTIVCSGAVITKTAGGAVSYSWSTGATSATASFSPQQSTSYTLTGTGANGCTASQVFSIAVNPCLGWNELDETMVRIFPNPFSSELTVDVPEKLSLSIYDINSRLMQKTELKTGANTIITSAFEPGLYIFKLSSDKGNMVKRFVKME